MPSLNQQILLAVLLGLVTGGLLTQLGDTSPLREGMLYSSTLAANLFVDLLKMILIPLVFSTIVVGVANLQAHKQIHKVWKTTLLFFFCSMSLAMILGLTVMNLFRPGEGMHLAMFADAMAKFEQKSLPPSEFLVQFLHSIFQNPFTALAKGDVLA